MRFRNSRSRPRQYDAGYGRKPGANVNVVTKSGTNQFHGTAFEFFRNTDLNANDFFRKISPPLNGVPNNGRQVLNQNQFGGVFGGPVKKDKLFFFASFQETWQKNGVSSAGYSAPIWFRFRQATVRTRQRSGCCGSRVLPGGHGRWFDFEWWGAGRVQRIEHQSGGHQYSST